ncbi:hypothetical protein BU24DRAFT_143964 [Aaosphaeria arxii CBS 175.79]|uniref:Uncharacterized protein n=1 Tax=Aaosphaeria arxii CBS 175.79 TaxID=1450172 RepID=A0A6A5XXX6_9PLEO|nr:uncharacterized protein BU24DRAFT_143964 [Aaosphaeria arxii CBS 175.79]KAF2017124.1 hypothetical protein BU24DRAFT_143964 [Aaosphaeria arxii CBS 175.79]
MLHRVGKSRLRNSRDKANWTLALQSPRHGSISPAERGREKGGLVRYSCRWRRLRPMKTMLLLIVPASCIAITMVNRHHHHPQQPQDNHSDARDPSSQQKRKQKPAVPDSENMPSLSALPLEALFFSLTR